MCGSLRREGESDVLGKKGEYFPVTLSNGKTVNAMWDGFARIESIDSWHANKWEGGDLRVSGYDEGYRPPQRYDVPSGYALKCVVRLIPGKGYIMKIQTRPAEGKEQAVHDRWPCMTKKRY